MNSIPSHFICTIPLTREAHRIAERFWKQQITPHKGKQVYLNTLAVYAVDFYLQCLGIETDLEKSDSWNPVKQSLVDTADLAVKNYGKLECCLVLPDAPVCAIPPEAQEDRIGYVAVQISESLREGTLLGFVKTVKTLELPIDQLQPLEDLIEMLSQSPQPEVVKKSVNLSQWFQNVVEGDWSVVDEIKNTLGVQSAFLSHRSENTGHFKEISPIAANAVPTLIQLLQTSEDPLTRFSVIELLGRIAVGNSEAITVLTDLLHTTEDDETRRLVAVSLGYIDPGNYAAGVRRAKVIDSGLLLAGHPVTLVVTIMPEEGKRTNIHLRVYPTGGHSYLPPNLQLMVLDELGEAFLEAQSRSADNWIQLEFSGEWRDCFSVKVALSESSWHEEFVI